jgi:uncharacterized coiled-coil protein SlyX
MRNFATTKQNNTMLDKRKEYINCLLQELKALESRVLTIKNEDTVPFSFFRESFDKTQTIMRLFHEMETLQIEDMKHQMERLVSFLSESASRKKEEEVVKKEVIVETPAKETIPTEEIKTEHLQEIRESEEVSEKFVLPEYKNPRKVESIPPPPVVETISEPVVEVVVNPVIEGLVEETKTTPRSLNDTIQKVPAVIDLKHGISLNDRFLFQRELFNNNRDEMNNMIQKLNSFNNYNDAEQFLQENTLWDFENQTVMDFLTAIQKGFK